MTVKHKWTIFVEIDNSVINQDVYKLIKKIHVGLDPEFYRQPFAQVIVKQGQPIEYTSFGCTPFVCKVTIFWTKESGAREPLTVDYPLKFYDGGKSSSFPIYFQKNKLINLFLDFM